jgi:SSS family solute:Na+ symporter
VLNSAVTIFAIDLYRPIWGRHLPDSLIIRRSKGVGAALALLSLLIAPLIMHFKEGIFQYMVKTEILFGSPIFLVFLVGHFSRTIPARAANITLVSFLVSLAAFQNLFTLDLHFLHLLALLFAVHAALIFLLAHLSPPAPAPIPSLAAVKLDLRPWPHFTLVSGIALAAMVLTYIIFSPWGLVVPSRAKSIDYGFIAAGLVLAAVIFGVPLRAFMRRPRDGQTQNEYAIPKDRIRPSNSKF